MNSKQFIETTTQDFESIIDDVINVVNGLSQLTMNLPEAEGKWSMLQCIKHISLATGVYVKNVEGKLSSNSNQEDSGKFKGSWKGRLFAKMNAPKPNGDIPNKLKTFKFMEPSQELNREEVIDEFITVHQKFITLIKQSASIDLDKSRVQTALPVVKLRLGDAYLFLLAHTKRHVVQLKRIKTTVLS